MRLQSLTVALIFAGIATTGAAIAGETPPSSADKASTTKAVKQTLKLGGHVFFKDVP